MGERAPKKMGGLKTIIYLCFKFNLIDYCVVRKIFKIVRFSRVLGIFEKFSVYIKLQIEANFFNFGDEGKCKILNYMNL